MDLEKILMKEIDKKGFRNCGATGVMLKACPYCEDDVYYHYSTFCGLEFAFCEINNCFIYINGCWCFEQPKKLVHLFNRIELVDKKGPYNFWELQKKEKAAREAKEGKSNRGIRHLLLS